MLVVLVAFCVERFGNGKELNLARIVMTGGTSGIGLVAAKKLITDGHELVIGARDGGQLSGCKAFSLDLSDLSNVRKFADEIEGPFDVLVLNAGLQNQNVSERTAQGFEMTFGVNHLAHYLLARLLLPKVADGGRIILTTSGTHDPEDKTGMPAPRHANADWLANPAHDRKRDSIERIAGLRAYSSSKLCNLMTVRSLSRLETIKDRRIEVVAYDPGLTPGTGLARTAPFLVRYLIMPILPVFSPFIKFMNSLNDAGTTLAELASGSIKKNGIYIALRRGKPTWPNPSKLALNDEATEKLWRDSARLVGFPDN